MHCSCLARHIEAGRATQAEANITHRLACATRHLITEMNVRTFTEYDAVLNEAELICGERLWWLHSQHEEAA